MATDKDKNKALAMLIRFLAKRATVLAVIVSMAVFIFFGFDPRIPIGILIGLCASLYKTKVFASFLSSLTATGQKGKRKIMLVQTFFLLFAFFLLVAAVFVDMRLFAGITAGLLLIPGAIFLNALTEWLSLTRNAWGESQAGG
jgi:hypothetical protein